MNRGNEASTGQLGRWAFYWGAWSTPSPRCGSPSKSTRGSNRYRPKPTSPISHREVSSIYSTASTAHSRETPLVLPDMDAFAHPIGVASALALRLPAAGLGSIAVAHVGCAQRRHGDVDDARRGRGPLGNPFSLAPGASRPTVCDAFARVLRGEDPADVARDRPGPALPFYAELAGSAARTRRERALEDLACTVAQGGRIRLLCPRTCAREPTNSPHPAPARLTGYFSFCSAWAWDGGGGGGTIGGGGLPSPLLLRTRTPNPTPFRATRRMLLRMAHVRAPSPPPLRSGVGGVAVTRPRPEGNASIATTRHPHSLTPHTHTQHRISLITH
eukprot:scaffold12924_cov125-Isochrysis_galbana.AAC.9